MAVVGTLLALLVFFALFGVFLTQYVPLWMDENEAQLSNGLVASLSGLKAGVDQQYLLGNIPTYSVPFTVSSQSVPLFAQPTVATLAYLSGCTSGFTTGGKPSSLGACTFESLAFTTGTTSSKGANHPFNQEATTDYLSVTVPNRYYPTETYYFENDAILGSESQAKQWAVVPPPLNISKSNGNLSFQTSMLIFLGNATSFTGIGSKDVSSTILSHRLDTSTSRFESSSGAAKTFNVTMTLGVYDVCGWYNYLYNTTYAALGAPSHGWSLGVTSTGGSVTTFGLSTCYGSVAATYDITLTILSVNYGSAFVVEDELGFNAGGL